MKKSLHFTPSYHVIIAGSRTITDYQFIAQRMDTLLKKKAETHQIVVFCGGAKGADAVGRKYAEERGYQVVTFRAKWEKIRRKGARIKYRKDGSKYDAAAGMVRNQEMAERAHACVVFIENNSSGSCDMIQRAKNHKLALRVYTYSRASV